MSKAVERAALISSSQATRPAGLPSGCGVGLYDTGRGGERGLSAG
jgi:hypothetical protein